MCTVSKTSIALIFLTAQLAFGSEWLETINNVTLSVQHKSGEILSIFLYFILFLWKTFFCGENTNIGNSSYHNKWYRKSQPKFINAMESL